MCVHVWQVAVLMPCLQEVVGSRYMLQLHLRHSILVCYERCLKL
jgi:hypothetical protein